MFPAASAAVTSRVISKSDSESSIKSVKSTGIDHASVVLI